MATESDATPYWYGDLYGDTIPSYTIFKHEWTDHYFTDEYPHKGRCFGIYFEDKLIGQINYNEIHIVEASTDMDIIIADANHHGRGLGSEAISLLVDHLFEEMNLRICTIEVLSQNPKAFHAYRKAGFTWAYTYVNEGIEWRVMEIRRSLWTRRKEKVSEKEKNN